MTATSIQTNEATEVSAPKLRLTYEGVRLHVYSEMLKLSSEAFKETYQKDLFITFQRTPVGSSAFSPVRLTILEVSSEDVVGKLSNIRLEQTDDGNVAVGDVSFFLTPLSKPVVDLIARERKETSPGVTPEPPLRFDIVTLKHFNAVIQPLYCLVTPKL